MTNVRIKPFEGNYYIRKKYLKTDQMRVNYFPGLCFYKFLYVWMDLHLGDGTRVRSLGWMYWLPNIERWRAVGIERMNRFITCR